MFKSLQKYDFKKIGFLLLILVFDVLMLMGIISLFGCSGNTRAAVSTQESISSDTTIVAGEKQQGFTLPVVPLAITDPSARAEYIVLHYWDSFDFSDTLIIRNAEIAEQAFVDYIVLFPHTTEKAVKASIHSTLESAHGTEAMHGWFTEMYEKYFYDPNSPFRNEAYFKTVVEHIVNDSQVDDIYKIRPQFLLEEINKNYVGTIAADFIYTQIDGKRDRLHKVKADYTLLFFYDPDCGDCKRVRQILEDSQAIAGMVDEGRLKIIALYTDNDLSAWKAYHPAIPEQWINGYDATKDLDIRRKLYAVRATPTLYLLDKDKRVVLKDCSVQEIIHGLIEN